MPVFPCAKIRTSAKYHMTTWWVPRESFFRIRMAITRNDGTPIQLVDDIAPAYAVCDNLYRSLVARI